MMFHNNGLTLYTVFQHKPPVPIIFVFNIFYKNIAYPLLNMVKIKRDTNQQDLKIVDLHFVKSE